MGAVSDGGTSQDSGAFQDRFKRVGVEEFGDDAANEHRPCRTEASSAAVTTASSSKSLLKLCCKIYNTNNYTEVYS